MNFILGSGRSGTTLLVSLLNNSDETISTPEISHFIFFYKKYRHVKEVSEELIKDYENYLQLIHDTKPLLNLIPIKETHISNLKPGSAINYAQLTKLFFLSLFKEKSDPGKITCIVDKTPFYTFCFHEINEVFPEAKILIMQRDARAFVYSNHQRLSQNYRLNPSVSYWSWVWKLYASASMEIKKQKGAQLLEMHYEDFVIDNERKIKRITEFFGIQFTDKIFEVKSGLRNLYKRFDDVLKDEKVNLMFKKLVEPVNALRVDSWKEGLSISQKKRVDCICGSSISLLGYAPVSHISFPETMVYGLRAIPAWFRVAVFKRMRSVMIYHYLNVERNKKHGLEIAKRFSSSSSSSSSHGGR